VFLALTGILMCCENSFVHPIHIVEHGMLESDKTSIAAPSNSFTAQIRFLGYAGL